MQGGMIGLVSCSLGNLYEEGKVSMVGFPWGCISYSILDSWWSMVSSRIGEAEVDGKMLQRDNSAICLDLKIW